MNSQLKRVRRGFNRLGLGLMFLTSFIGYVVLVTYLFVTYPFVSLSLIGVAFVCALAYLVGYYE